MLLSWKRRADVSRAQKRSSCDYSHCVQRANSIMYAQTATCCLQMSWAECKSD